MESRISHYEKIENFYSMIDDDFFWSDVLCSKIDKYYNAETDILFENFIKLNPLQIVIDKISLESPKDLTTAIHFIYYLYHFRVCGRKIYNVSGGISSLFLNTRLDINSDVLKIPFNCICIEVPNNLFCIYNDETGKHDVDCVYVMINEYADKKILRCLVVGSKNKNSKFEFDDALFYYKVELKCGKISSQLSEQIEQMRIENSKNSNSEHIAKNIDMVDDIFSYVLNCLLYITSKDADVIKVLSQYKDNEKKLSLVKSTKKIKRRAKELARTSKLDKYSVGSTIVINKSEEKGYGISREFFRGKQMVRGLVCGHWRNQWKGSEKDFSRKQELVWIKPFWRGPELAEIINSKYKIVGDIRLLKT